MAKLEDAAAGAPVHAAAWSRWRCGSKPASACGMYIVTITYPKSPESTFDFDYFRTRHLPEVGKAFGPFGLGFASVLRGEQSLDGKDPAFYVTTILSFATEEGARGAVASDAAKALARDIANFTSVKPLMQFNTAVR